jgi:hypothetical protein
MNIEVRHYVRAVSTVLTDNAQMCVPLLSEAPVNTIRRPDRQ